MQDEQILEQRKHSYKIFDEIAGSYDLLNRTLSVGIDLYWRKKLVGLLPKKIGQHVLDLATGTGDVAHFLLKSPNVGKVVGVDPSVKMVEVAQKKLQKYAQAGRIELIVASGESLPFNSETFDATTVAFGIRNYQDHLKGLQEMSRVLKKGGVSLILEFSIPKLAGLKQLYLFYFRNVLPRIGNLLSGHKTAYTYLNKTAETFPSGQAFIDQMKSCGFTNVTSETLTFGIATIYRGEKN